MKSIVTTVCMLLACISSEAQGVYGIFPNNQIPGMFQKKKNYIKNAGVQTRRYEYYSKHGQLKKWQVSTFNKAGQGEQYQLFDKKNKLVSTTVNLYRADTFMIGQATINAKGDTAYQYRYSYDEQGRVLGYYSRSGKKGWENVYTYNDKNQRAGSVTRINGKLRWRTEYEYNDSGKMIASLLYNAKNVLKKKTTYLCDYRGESVNKEVKQTNMCTRHEAIPGGGFMVYDDRTNEKGELQRYIYTYSSDSSLMQYEAYNIKNRLVTKRMYTYNREGSVTQEVVFGKKGVLYSNEYLYNEKNLLTSASHYNRGKQRLSSEAYQYTYY